MKNKILLFHLLITVFSYSSAMTSFGNKHEIEKTIIKLDNVKQGQLLIIKDYRGAVLYNEVLEKEGTYSKVFNLSELPQGEYYFELKKDLEIKVLPFKVKHQTVEILSEKEFTLFVPIIRSKKNKIYLSRMSMNNMPLKVNIYYEGDNDEELIYSENIKNQNIIERIYALDERLKGLYKIIVSTEGRSFSQVVNL